MLIAVLSVSIVDSLYAGEVVVLMVEGASLVELTEMLLLEVDSAEFADVV